ncbi:MAG: carboxypeptidase regulatory-like domain-containing protein, partial [Deltaproteobacteria bacterium]|nr:carboxypeptidase regulatory-like domain-containing protein [Deltaproteobacteria bacterium]
MMKIVVWILLLLLSGFVADAAPIRVVVLEDNVTGVLDAPIPGKVVAERHSSTEAPDAPTTAEIEIPVPGTKRLDLEPGTWSFHLKVDGFWAPPVVLSVQEEEIKAEFVMWPTGTLRALLAATQGEKPPAQVQVRFDPAPEADQSKKFPEGIVVCPAKEDQWHCEVPAGLTDLRLSAEGYISHYRWGVEVVRNRVTEVGTLHFRRGSAVVGNIETENGDPANDATITLRPRTLHPQHRRAARSRLEKLRFSAESNDRGFFHLDGVAPGDYEIEASKEPFAPARATVRVLEGEETVIARPPLVLYPPQVIEIYIDPPVPPVGDEWQLKAMQLSRSSQSLAVIDTTPVSPAGLWTRSDMTPGRYGIIIEIEDRGKWLSKVIELEPDMPPVFIDVPVIEVRGKVFWGEDPLFAEIWFGRKNGAESVAIESDEDGIFAGFIPRPGLWNVEVIGINDAVHRNFQIDVSKRPSKNYAEVEIRIPDTALEGEIVTENGQRVDSALVMVQPFDEVTRSIRKQTDGSFEIRGLPAGICKVVAEETLGETYHYSQNALVHLKEGEAQWVRLVLRPVVRIRGRIVAGDQGVAGAQILAEPATDHGMAIPVETSDAEGNFEVYLPEFAQELFLNVAAPGYAKQFFRVPVDPGRHLTVPVSRENGTIVLELPDDLDLRLWNSPSVYLVHRGAITSLAFPLAGQPVRLWLDQGRRKFTIPGMEVGEYAACLARISNRTRIVESP